MQSKTIVLAVCLALAVTSPALATVPHLLAWQGVALDSLDVPLADGSYMFTFSIWSAGDGGDSLWGEGRIVNVENGVLNILLGDSLPIPDSVFDLPNRWLQVQFESEAPYYPRTRIVSVGYAFRVNSLDGAQGGVVSSDIELKAFGTVPKFRVFREGTNTVIGELAGSGSGGRLTLYNGTGGKIVELDPSASPGGQFVLWTHPSSSTGIVMDNTGNNNPYLLMQGQTTGAILDMDSVGDPSVILPPSAISKSEILDEPGLASSSMTSASTAITTTYTQLESTSAGFPNSGYAIVYGEASINAGTANTWMDCRILEDGVEKAFCWWEPGDVDTYYDQRQSIMATLPVTAGVHTYTMELRQFSGTASAAYSKLTVLYVPTSYGTVSSPVASGPVEDAAFAEGRQVVGPPKVVDPAAGRAEAERANQARIQAELDEMKARMVQLEGMLQNRASDPATEDR